MTRAGGGGRIRGIAKTAPGGLLVIATRRDGPHYAQRTRTAWGGVFAFEALPPGEYVVSLPDYDTTATVTVVDQQTATVEVALPVLVRLRIKVTGRPHPSTPPVLEAIAPDGGASRPPGMSSSLNVVGVNGFSFKHDVRPGNYRFSPDGETWTSITVHPSPPEQTIEIYAPASPSKV